MRTTEELLAGLDTVKASPTDDGVLQLIVARKEHGEREVLDSGELSVDDGLIGDTWRERGSKYTDDGSAEEGRQLTLMNSRAIALFAGDPGRWALAGDQLYVDLDLSDESLPAGTTLAIGRAVIEVSAEPHTGCAKFRDRFGIDVSRFVNSDEGSRLHLRGINARVITPGTIRVGDRVARVRTAAATAVDVAAAALDAAP